MKSKEPKEPKIYWEKQGQDKLCGVHCLNTLVQGPHFDEVQNNISLSTLALELDKKEQELMGGNFNMGGSQFKNEGSNNVALDGNFSIQVLAEALKTIGDISVESIDSKINQKQDLCQEEGFICNSSSHWFTIKKIGTIWYNLNSTNRGGPELVSDFYLSAFLQSIKEGGYTIFVIKGFLPYFDDPQSEYENVNKHQKWFSKAQIQAIHQKRLKKKNYKLNIGGTDEKDYEEAIKRSMGQKMEEESEDELEQFEDPDKWQPEQQKVVPFQGNGVQISKVSQSVNYSKFELNQDCDPELAFAIKMSLESKFVENIENGITIAFKLPDGKQIQSTFLEQHTVEDLYDFILIKIPEGECYKFILQTTFPLKLLNNVNLTLLEAGIDDMTQIIVSKI